MLKDHRFLGFLQSTPEFLGHLDELQKRILANAVRFDILLRYFWVSISPEQLRELETLIVEKRVEEVEQEEMLEEIARQMPLATKAARREDEAIVRVMDYKTEMCQMIDNIKDVEVFRCIDIDMPDNTTSNLQIT